MRSPNILKVGKRGFSLTETILVLALLGILLSTGIIIDMRTYRQANLLQERETLVSLLENQRAHALANIHNATHGLHIDTDAFTLFEGTYDPDNPQNTVLERSTHAAHQADDTITFAQLSGESVDGLHTIVLGQNEVTTTVTVNVHGRIDW